MPLLVKDNLWPTSHTTREFTMIKKLADAWGIKIIQFRAYAFQPIDNPDPAKRVYVDAQRGNELFETGKWQAVKDDPHHEKDLAVIRYQNNQVVVPVLDINTDLSIK